MNRTIQVDTGRVKVARKLILKSQAIGSCVVVAAYDPKKKVGAMAHIMLPGESPKSETSGRTRYAVDAINVMLQKAARLGVQKDDFVVCLVGGANVLKRDDDTICKDNIASVFRIIKETGLKIMADILGGTKRKTVSFDVENGSVFYSEENENEKLLWTVAEMVGQEKKSVKGAKNMTMENEGEKKDSPISREVVQTADPQMMEEFENAQRSDLIIKEYLKKRKKELEGAQNPYLNFLEDMVTIMEEKEKKTKESEQGKKTLSAIMEDLERKKREAEETQNAYLNLMEDLKEKNKELEGSQWASLNIMEDLDKAYKKLQTSVEREKELAAQAATAEIERKRASEMEEAYKSVEKANQDLKETTAQLVQSAKLSAIGELTAGVAHELNQPLNVMKIICQGILRDISKGRFDKENAKEDLPEILQQVNKMAEIVDHMRIFTRSTTGAQREAVSLNRVIENGLKFFTQQLKERNIEVVKELHPDLPKVMGDAIRLEQILVNLITNARDALESKKAGDKKIEIRTYLVEAKQSIGVDISDNGSGIPENLREKIFQPFFTTKEPGKGTGLGLSVASKILEEHKGKLELDSTVGKGTTFKILLPFIP